MGTSRTSAVRRCGRSGCPEAVLGDAVGLKAGAGVPIAGEMTRLCTLTAAALAVAVGLGCAAAALIATRLDLSSGADAALVGVAALSWTSLGVALVHRAAGAQRRGRERLRQLAEMLEVSGSEEESRALLLGHAQRLLPEAGAAMLIRSEADDRLAPTFGERVADTPLRGLIVGHPRPQACLALRLGHTHARSASREALAGCELCGRLPGDSVCEPLQASGRMLGALIVASLDPIDASSREQLREATALAAPRLALQRVLATVDQHAALDQLTGLPNRRAAEQTLARLAAQAGRTVTSLAAVLVDLDHFATVNDRFGHELGDGALARIGQALAGGVRASDFVARYGGQAFIVLAPDTGRTGAAELAEKLRSEIEQLALEGVGQVTASLGVAALPEDAAAPAALVRRAERALGMAKALGRNRVATPEPSPASEG